MVKPERVGKSVVGVKSNFRAMAIARLLGLSSLMRDTGAFLDFYGGFGEIGQHGKEMIGASKIAAGWADGLEKENESGSKKASPPTKLKKQTEVAKTRRRPVVQKPGNRPAKPGVPKLQRVPKKRSLSRD